MITSKNNKNIKNVRALLTSSRERREQGLFVIEGSRLVSEAPAGLIEEVYVSSSFVKNGVECIPCDVDYEVVSDDVFRSLSDTVNPQGILAVVRMPAGGQASEESLVNKTDSEKEPFAGQAQGHASTAGLERIMGGNLYVLLDDIRDPGNLGTIFRTAEAAGARVIMSETCADLFNPKTVRSTMGTIFRVPFAICPVAEAIERLHEEGVTVCAAMLDGSVPYTELDVSGAVAFIIGNEANGVSAAAAEAADRRVRIPMKGRVESLNAAVSAAILMYSVFRS